MTSLNSGGLGIGQDSRRPLALQHAVLRALAYSDVFDYPLTAAEVRWAMALEASAADVESTLRSMPDRISEIPPYYTLKGREGTVVIRERRRVSSALLVRRARSWGRVISALPFVYSVIVTGSLAVDNAEMDEDVDFLIVTRPGRVWTARAFTVGIVHLARRRGVELCPNYVVAADALAMNESAYAARELAQMRPLSGVDVAQRLLHENPWWHEHLPNATPAAFEARPLRSMRWLQLLPEALLGGRVGNVIEAAILRSRGDKLRRDAGANAEATFDAHMAKGHVEAHRSRIEAALAQRLAALGLGE